MTNRGDLYQERTKGKDVRVANILAAKVKHKLVRSENAATRFQI